MDEFLVESDESWEGSTALLRVKHDPYLDHCTCESCLEPFPGTEEEARDVLDVMEEIAQEILAPADLTEAQQIAQEIEFITDQITEKEAWLQIGWVKLGMLVNRVHEKKFWLDYGYQNFPAFVQDIASRVDRKRSYIYQCRGIAERLLPQLPPDTLIEMGISKAGELQKLTKLGKLIPQEIIDKALTAKIYEVRAVVQTALNPAAPLEEGKWFDLGGCYFTKEELTLYKLAFDCALKDADQPIATDLADHVQKKIVLTRFAAEYLSTHGGQ